ncbi:MAG: ParB/RepB/Spo0J family partition protein [Asticcacaulis sp.]|uniref:ParB/RepB/Spo0J family partition protein n=1 Tax=Asticcacaulis sp. TaxID=1872648 RepID=UPI003F7C0781
MTTTKNLIPLSRSLDIPFNKLVLSQANVRQIHAGVSLDDLREDIAVRGLLQSLNVRPILDEEGAETGKYEVPAGGRRFRALEQLVKAKRLPKTAPIPCVIKSQTSDTSLEDDSLAENTHRVALHPLDQYRAFLALRRQNMSEEDIAARYFVSVSVVRQRLRLASVSPALLNLYAADELSLDQLTAFSVTGDHQRQEELWQQLKAVPAYMREAYHIRRHLTDSAVATTDRRAVFIGVEAYEAAGGAVLRDLFSADESGWLQDAVLLDRLVGDKLHAIADEVAIEGWKWVEVLPSLPFDHLYGLRKLDPTGADLNEDDQAVLNALKVEYDALNDEYSDWDELPDEIDARLGELETKIEAFEGPQDTAKFDAAEIGRAGVIVTVDRAGSPQILRGYIRPEDELTEDPQGDDPADDGDAQDSAKPAAIIAIGSAHAPAPAAEEDEGDVVRPIPEKLILELTAYRTVALRDAVARNPRVAMTMLLHKLVSDTFHLQHGGSCLQVSVFHPSMVNIAPKGLNETVPAEAMAHRHSLWGDVIPADDQALWDWLDGETDDVRSELLAFCVSFGVNAIKERPNPYGAGVTEHSLDIRLKQAMRVARATDLDLVALGWRPTAETYLNRVPRARILEAVREGCGDRKAQMIDHLKKGDMVVEAERLLADTGWLPEVLRGSESTDADPQAATDALPAFLEDGADLADEEADPAPVAAE